MALNASQERARRQFEKQSSRYGKSHILADVSDIEQALRGIEPRPGDKALDVACGGGHVALFLARAGWDVTVSDVSRAMVRNTRHLLAESGCRCTTRIHTAEKFPFRDASFNLVACRVAAHHFSAPKKFFAEVARVLRPGGIFLLIDGVAPDSSKEAADWIHRVEKLRDPSHGRFLTPDLARQWCHDVGLQIRRSKVTRMRQPKLEWYFDTAATPEANRNKVLRLVESASPEVAETMRLKPKGLETVWYWHRLALIAVKRIA